MSDWAQISDIVKRRGQDAVRILGTKDIENDTASMDKMQCALDDAQSEMETAIKVRFPDLEVVRSLDPIPSHLQLCTIDIAVYRMAETARCVTKEMRTRYDDCIRWLNLLIAGKRSIGTDIEIPTGSEGGDMELHSQPPQWTRPQSAGVW